MLWPQEGRHCLHQKDQAKGFEASASTAPRPTSQNGAQQSVTAGGCSGHHTYLACVDANHAAAAPRERNAGFDREINRTDAAPGRGDVRLNISKRRDFNGTLFGLHWP